MELNGHDIIEWENTGLFYCKKCNKGEIELEDKCLK